jgi:hypothetical protein
MSRRMSGVLVTYGILVAISGILLRKITPEIAPSVLTIGIVAGALCLVFGIRGFLGCKRRVEAIMTVTAVTFAILIQVIPSYMDALANKSPWLGAGILTALFLITIGMLLYLFHGERPPEFYNERGAP